MRIYWSIDFKQFKIKSSSMQLYSWKYSREAVFPQFPLTEQSLWHTSSNINQVPNLGPEYEYPCYKIIRNNFLLQICNWFANWRRKLKNAGKEPQRMTWSHLIKKYNSQAHGNVEHFSICSEDSIWQETEEYDDQTSPNSSPCSATMDHSYTVPDSALGDDTSEQGNSKYKSHIMEKYLKDLTICRNEDYGNGETKKEEDPPRILSKWLQSAANFRPRQKNYVDWDYNEKRNKLKTNGHRFSGSIQTSAEMKQHGREELDAAEALTRLACAHAVAI